jgi:carboxyl-terminal processing protease
MIKYKNNILQIFLPLIIAGSLILGMFISIWMGAAGSHGSFFRPAEKDKLSLVIEYILNEYVDEVDREEIVEITIPELLKTLDPHSLYIDPNEAAEMMEELHGEFDGIGVQFNIFRDTILIVNTIPGGPSEKAGVLAGDRIIMIDDSLVAGVGIINPEVMKKLKGEKNTQVKIEILRQGNIELIPFTITRGHIPLNSVESAYMITDKIAYIKITSFSRTTHNHFVEELRRLKKENRNLESLILDLRENAGGFLSAATNIADEFLGGANMLVYTEGRSRPKNETFSTNNRRAAIDLKLAVLIDEFSASASEIVAGAIQDNDRGFIIGRRSYGKGLVQEAIDFSDGSMMRLTTARYYTPAGRSIQKDYEEGFEEYYYDVFKRFEHGEFHEKDSIQFDEDLIFYTKGGREVYGGGGIMPDIFVPFDTAGYTTLLGAIRAGSHDYFFAVDYLDKNRDKLSQISNVEQLVVYLDRSNVMSLFYKYLADNSIHADPEEIKISGRSIKNNVYAYIARQRLDDNAFYYILNQHNATVNKAIEVLNTEMTVFDL